MFNSRISEIESPCFDRKTKTDCPRRCAGCSVDCPEWNKYLKERDELYKKRKIESAANEPTYDSHNRCQKKIILQKIKDGRRHR